MSIVGDMKYCQALIRLFREEKPDVTFGYKVKPCIYGAIAAKRASVKNINSMITGGGYTFTSRSWKARILGIIVRFLYRTGLSCTHHVIFQNNDDLREFCESGLVKRDKCFVVSGSGVNMEHFRPIPFPKQITFLMISRLLKSKGVGEISRSRQNRERRTSRSPIPIIGKI